MFFCKQLIIAAAGIILLSACAHKARIHLTDEITAPLLPISAAAVKTEEEYRHKMRVAYILEGREYNREFISALKLSPTKITTVALTTFVRLFTIEYSPAGISCETSPLLALPEGFIPEYILFDIQLIYYPADILNEFLPRGVKVIEKIEGALRSRYVCHGDDCFIKIVYKSGGSFSFTNELRKYSYTAERLP
ncbi:MAG: DUF3261 domain-containing protein [Deferribacteraceae bacterium]|jgi:hypothetical protein|nr:DUF3261 domain-containing protein [Deferribacteraceae bacterium]